MRGAPCPLPTRSARQSKKATKRPSRPCSPTTWYSPARWRFHDSTGGNHALEFEAGIAGAPGVTINGCDFLHVNEDGLIDDFKVMVRPLSGATALAEAMGAQFGRIQQEAVELADQFAKAPTA
jgi:hypothetical protein